jgi:hypothetical protein
MSVDPSAPLSSIAGGIWLQRTVGALALLSGLALVALFAFVLYKISGRLGEVASFVLSVLVFLALIGSLLLSSGARMLANRPNKYGSIFTPVTCFVGAALFFSGGAFLVVSNVAAGASSSELKPVLHAFFFGALCTWAGVHIMKTSRQGSRGAA